MEDVAALSRVMHGAASQQPADTPLDAYGNPYIIGNLGGYPVNLPSSVVSLLEYDDSPGWDREKLRHYQPPTRNYQSIIDSFGFSLRYRDHTLLDSRKNQAEYEQESDLLPNPWIDVGITSGTIMRRIRPMRPQPRLSAASFSELSMFFSAPET